MGTEEDKPNNAVLITIFVIGGAGMIGGSAAIVGMTRTEMDQQSFDLSAYADLDTVRELRDSQRKSLQEAKLPIDRARNALLVDINRNPRNASWATPEPSVSATAEPSASASGSVEPASTDAPGAGGAPAVAPIDPSAQVAPKPSTPDAPEPLNSKAPTPLDNGPNEGAPNDGAPGHDAPGHGAPGHDAPAPHGTH
jgi:hypothetical protein